MSRPPLFGIGMQTSTPVVTAKLLTNVYCEFRQQGEKTQVIGKGTPGLRSFASPSIYSTRGKPILFDQNDLIYLVQNNTLWEVNNAGTATIRGTLATSSGFVVMAHNGFSILIVDGIYGYYYNPTTLAFTQIVAAAFPSNPTSVTFLDGYYLVSKGGTGQYNRDSLYNAGPLWLGSALDFAVAESAPDNLIRVTNDHSQLILLGASTTEFHGASPDPNEPFVRIEAATCEWGLAAIASLVKFDNSIAFLARNILGQVTVIRLNGYQPMRISNSDLESVINKYAVVSDARGYSYMLNGHPMMVLNFPSAGYSWLFDGSTGIWTSLKSFNVTRHRGEFAVDYLGKTIVTDYNNGNLYVLDELTYTDNGDMIEREIIGEHWDSPDLEREPIYMIRADMETGVGLVSGQGENPQLMLQYSKNRGRTWSSERWRPFGKIGEYKANPEWNRFGQARHWTFKMRMADPVKFTMLGLVINPGD